jgi:hypothetical protein
MSSCVKHFIIQQQTAKTVTGVLTLYWNRAGLLLRGQNERGFSDNYVYDQKFLGAYGAANYGKTLFD